MNETRKWGNFDTFILFIAVAVILSLCFYFGMLFERDRCIAGCEDYVENYLNDSCSKYFLEQSQIGFDAVSKRDPIKVNFTNGSNQWSDGRVIISKAPKPR